MCNFGGVGRGAPGLLTAIGKEDFREVLDTAGSGLGNHVNVGGNGGRMGVDVVDGVS